MESLARAAAYTLMGIAWLLSAAIVGGLGAFMGSLFALVSHALLCLAVPSATALRVPFWMCGALVGGVYGSLCVLGAWLDQARNSEDPALRSLAQRLDALLHATRRPR